jgi:hypothetical protein
MQKDHPPPPRDENISSKFLGQKALGHGSDLDSQSPSPLLGLQNYGKWVKSLVGTELFLYESCKVLLELSGYYGYDGSSACSKQSIRHTVEHWKTQLPTPHYQKDAISFLKYKSAAFSAHVFGEVLPKPPNGVVSDRPDVLMSGSHYRWLKSFGRRSKRSEEDFKEYFSFGVSVLLGWKTACPSPDEVTLEISKSNTFETLTDEVKEVEVKADWSKDFIPPSPKEMEEECRRTTIELFQGKSLSVLTEVFPFLPSVSSNVLRTRKQLGSVGFFCDIMKEQMEESKDDDPILFEFLNKAYRYKDVLEATQSLYRPSEAREDNHKVVINDSLTLLLFQSWITQVLEMALVEEPIVKLTALAEPFKVRIISRGPPATMTILKIVQRFMWNTLKEHRTFQLVGEPVSEEMLQNVVGTLHPGEVYTSVDYKAATDSLYSRYSEAVVDGLILALTPKDSPLTTLDAQLLELTRRLLTQHLIENPDEGGFKAQTRGQLMGSVVSFPVLCILNATIIRVAFEMARSGGVYINLQDADKLRLLLILLPLLINGDDGIFRSFPEVYRLWVLLCPIMGFTPSVGKTYSNDRFCQINSASFLIVKETRVWKGKERKCSFSWVNFINMGLIYGKSRSSASGAQKALLINNQGTVGARMRSLDAWLPDFVDRKKVLGRFMKKNESSIKQLGLPYFIPEVCGGLGLIGAPVESDLKVALLLDHIDYDLGSPKLLAIHPTWKRSDGVLTALSDRAGWQIRQLAHTSLPPGVVNVFPESKEDDSDAQRIDGLFSAMTFLNPKVVSDRSLIYKEATDDGAMMSIVHNNRKLINLLRPIAKKFNPSQTVSVTSASQDEGGEWIVTESVRRVGTQHLSQYVINRSKTIRRKTAWNAVLRSDLEKKRNPKQTRLRGPDGKLAKIKPIPLSKVSPLYLSPEVLASFQPGMIHVDTVVDRSGETRDIGHQVPFDRAFKRNLSHFSI